MAGSLATINIKFAADLKDFSTQMANANRQLVKHGKQLQSVGKGFSTYLTAPLAALTAVSLVNYNKQAQAIAQVEAGLKSTGNQVGYTSEQLQQMASDLQDNTLFGDEEILQGATAQLLTFTNIAGNQFKRTQQAALDLATRLDGDLKSASIQLGKALNDPVANLSALSRSGIQFSEDQKAMINSLVETNRLADAQTLILDELSAQYGGSAAAAAEAGTGGMKQLSNILGDLSEDFGKIINEALKPFIAKIKEWAIAFRNLSPETKKVIVIVGALAAAIGPLLVALGFLMTTVIPGLITAFTFLSGTVLPAVIGGFNTLTAAILANPISILVAAIAGVVYAFVSMLQKITPVVSKLKTFFNLVKSGGNQALFLKYQMLDVADAFAEETKVTEAAAKAKAKFISDQEFAAEATKKLTEELLKQNTVIAGGGESRKSVTNIETTTSGVDEGFTNIPNSLKTATDLASTHLLAFQQKLTFFQEHAGIIGDAVGNSFRALSSTITQSLETGNVVLDAFVSTIINSFADLAAAFLSQLIIEKIFASGKKVVDYGKASSNAIVIASSAAAAMGPLGIVALPGLIASQLAVITGAFAGISAFADGGIVSGSSYFGDKLLAYVNSGEAIFNQKQQKALYNGLTAGQAVTVHITGELKGKGTELVGVINHTIQQKSRTS